MDGYGSYYQPRFYSTTFEYAPRIQNGSISISPCCLGDRGNVVLMPFCIYDDQTVDLSDLTALISYLFINHKPICCLEEADMGDPSDGIVDLSDLTKLIDYLFISFTPLPTCP